MITVVDYGMGNLRSVQKALHRVGYEAEVSSNPDRLSRSRLLVVPGVGAFDQAVRNLKTKNIWRPVSNHLHAGKPYLGICLGLQLLFEGSQEGSRTGFGFFRGEVISFQKVRVVPHMGWNNVRWRGRAEEFKPPLDDPCYYFVHSYFPVPENKTIVAGTADYGGEFCAAVRAGNCFGIQFHPEKSQYAGLSLLKNYCRYIFEERN